ncbi:MAG: hypothetical protein AABW88_03180, partial [Nanoarchaeota archaeon]
WEKQRFKEKSQVFTPEEVKNLQEWQDFGKVHEFTCGNDHCKTALIPTTRGWICSYCDYTQNWAHDHCKNGSIISAMKEMAHDEPSSETTALKIILSYLDSGINASKSAPDPYVTLVTWAMNTKGLAAEVLKIKENNKELKNELIKVLNEALHFLKGESAEDQALSSKEITKIKTFIIQNT